MGDAIDTFELVRATPPLLTSVSAMLSESLREISLDERTGNAFHCHRFGGTTEDKEAGATWCGRRLGTKIDPERVVVTNGTQNSLLMLVTSLVGPGGILLTEALSYPQIGAICDLIGATVKPIEIDELGVIPGDFRRCCEQHRPNAVYLIPSIQNPTATILPNDRRREVAEIARFYGVPIIEDDAQAFLSPDAPQPIAAFAPEITWYVLTLSKSTSVGLRVGYFVSPNLEQQDKVNALFKRMSMWFCSPISAILATRWINDGTANRILDAIRSEMSARHQVLREELTCVSYQSSPNSLHVWLKGEGRLKDPNTITTLARTAGVQIRNWEEFRAAQNRGPVGARVSLTSVDKETLRMGLRILNKALA
ncbi:DNA-binding transcriptional MocR family regulator [Ensifer sp. SEMIA 135]|uniref:aminotransferase-like domain-containing protein n=1 Tax=Rhizobium meliloti TaxID=382 RepID=UPI000FD9BF14|nr:PLP-dependent aminotransferase family protein [Sinorhizobium meliloti]RVL27256.1 PLP-dependent aminotransferase family protein [Sinorhizobium meliloti]RVP95495.1 PLP-dependent aminotransferase family protein [Sinorhizobium meliloti]TWA89121.1 DNA-binding transcriptional MocR family regulator [Ensifer sp. SEMIA 134]TWB25194.1 DNA-binding transcriptional MocR family regulator [Ensifer sp. SEMIA 135]